ncbi:MAG: hypothetical protein ACT4P2_16750 [Pseudomonadota bacterium]
MTRHICRWKHVIERLDDNPVMIAAEVEHDAVAADRIGTPVCASMSVGFVHRAFLTSRTQLDTALRTA